MATQRSSQLAYDEGYRDGYRMGYKDGGSEIRGFSEAMKQPFGAMIERKKSKRKLSAWQKFVKANSKKKMFRYRDGKINLKKMGVAYRKKKRR